MFTTQTWLRHDWAAKRTNVEAKSTEFNIQSTAFLGAIAKDKGLFYWNTF